MKVPKQAFAQIRAQLWQIADQNKWLTLSDQDKSRFYEEWIRNEEIGGFLRRYLDSGSVRVYIKDTLMKPYTRNRTSDFDSIMGYLGIGKDIPIAESYVKPHGRRLADGRVISWGLARDWKAIMIATFERAHCGKPGIPYASLFLAPHGRLLQDDFRYMVELASERLGIQTVKWIDF